MIKKPRRYPACFSKRELKIHGRGHKVCECEQLARTFRVCTHLNVSHSSRPSVRLEDTAIDDSGGMSKLVMTKEMYVTKIKSRRTHIDKAGVNVLKSDIIWCEVSIKLPVWRSLVRMWAIVCLKIWWNTMTV